MRKFTKYIFLLLCFLTACQRVELVDPSLVPDLPEVSGEATVKISVCIPGELQTKAMGDSPATDIKNLYLVIFDSNGYFVEACQAEIGTRTDNVAEYKVTLTMTNQRRIIHFIANCPIDQIEYGHENVMISKLYVRKAQNTSEFETAYWHRKVVDYIIADEDGNLLDSNSQVLVGDANPLRNVPLLRNYTKITVEDSDNEDDNFHLLSYAVYNTIDIGTVAPYNKSKQEFQMFGRDNVLFSYDRLLSEGFEGHALAEAQLDSVIVDSDFMEPGTPFYMYERKISVRSNHESQWDESPTHIILKGIYTGKGYETNTTPTYYKVDLIREVNNSHQYYNLLRNFDYTFKLRSVVGAGYKTIQDAMSNPAGNNLAGSTHTQELTDVSDGKGRIMVSYTDTTLVSNHDITFKFRYIPDIHNPVAANNSVSLQGELDGNGNVLKGLKTTIDYGSDGDDWATVVFRVNDPTDVAQIQEITLNAGNNPNLQKTIRFRLMKPYSLEIACYNRSRQDQTFENPYNIIDEGIGKQLGIYMRIPSDLNKELFPLEFKVEADKLSISPDADEGNVAQVVSAPSVIPGKPDPSFHYLYRITYDEYSRIASDGSGKKVLLTKWLTNIVKSASYVVVDNKYFNIAASYFRNNGDQTEQSVLGHKRRFTDLRIDPNPVFKGKDVPVQIMFDLDSREQNFLPKKVHVELEGMVCTKHKDTSFDVFLTANAKDDEKVISTLPANTKVVEMQPGSRSVVIDGLITTVKDHSDTKNEAAETGPIRFTLSTPESANSEVEGYHTVSSDVATRTAPYFTMLSISPNPIIYGVDVPVDIKFMMDSDDEKYFERNLTVKLHGLKTPEGDESINITPTQGSLVVRLSNLLTTDAEGDVSFTIEENGQDYNKYETRISDVATRRLAEFWGLRFNPVTVSNGIDRKVSISFNMDEEDEYFANRELTLTLTGMEYVAPDGKRLSTLTFTPSEKSLFPNLTRYMTIGNLVTTTETGNLSFSISAQGYNNEKATAEAKRSAVEFKNLSFTREGNIVSRINEGETVDFNFTMSYYEPGMTVDVTLDGFEPYQMPSSGDGSLVPADTRAATSYVFRPYEKNCKLKLKAVATESSSYSVQLAAANYGYASKAAGISKAIYKFDATASTYNVSNQNTEITINFTIPAEAWQAGVNTMPVNITLGRLVPTENNKLVGSDGSYVYNVTKRNDNKYNFKVKPSESGAGICTVKLEAAYFETATINNIVQTVNHALKMTNYVNVGNNEAWRAQAFYQLSEPMEKNTQYTFTCKVKSSATNQVGIFIKNTDGQQQQTWNISMSNISASWSQCTVTFTTDNNNSYNLLMFNIGTFVGDVYIDDVSLMRTTGNNKKELMRNNDFENGSDGWDITVNNDNNSNPRCEVTVVEEPK